MEEAGSKTITCILSDISSCNFKFLRNKAFLHLLSADYVTKMVYNKDKDLVFVYRLDGYFSEVRYLIISID